MLYRTSYYCDDLIFIMLSAFMLIEEFYVGYSLTQNGLSN